MKDRRIQKTQKAIYIALNDLMQRKKYANITVQEIIDEANVGRTTFYSHFETKDELLSKFINNIFDNLILTVSQENEGIIDIIPVVGIFEHLRGHDKILKGLLSSEGGELFYGRATVYWTKNLEIYFTKNPINKVKIDIPEGILVNHIITSMIGLIKWWIINDMPYTPLEMNEYWKRLIDMGVDINR